MDRHLPKIAKLICLALLFSLVSCKGSFTISSKEQNDAPAATMPSPSPAHEAASDKTASALTIDNADTLTFTGAALELKGTCENGLSVVFTGDVTRTEIDCLKKRFTVQLQLKGADGDKVVTVSQTDAAKNATTVQLKFVKDATAPSPPLVDVDNSVPFRDGEISLSYYGDCSPEDTKELQIIAEGDNLAATKWQVCAATINTKMAGLSNGIQTLKVYARDRANNVSPASDVDIVNLTTGDCYDNPNYITSTNVLNNGSDPFVICTLEQMQQMANDLSVSYRLGADIIATKTNPSSRYNAGSTWADGLGWQPIGSSMASKFDGSLDGQNHEIRGLHINRATTNYIGLIGYLDDDQVLKRIKLTMVDITGQNMVGALLGRVFKGTVEDVLVSGSVVGKENVGGLIGNVGYTSSVSRVSSTADVRGEEYVGGLGGMFAYATCTECRATGTVEATGGDAQALGGLVGGAYQGSYDLSYATADITGTYMVAGLLGYCEDATVTNSYAVGNITGYWSVGGLLGGDRTCKANRTFATGQVTCEPIDCYAIGGLVGEISEGEIANSYALGNVYLDYSSVGGYFVAAGGLAGEAIDASVSTSYASGHVRAIAAQIGIGGLVGWLEDGSLQDSFSIGAVNNAGDLGGLIGSATNAVISGGRWFQAPGTDAVNCWDTSIGAPAATACTTIPSLAPFLDGTLNEAPLSTWDTSYWEPRTGKLPRLKCPAGWPWDCDDTWYAAQD